MSDPFDKLIGSDTDDHYMDRAEFFLGLKEKLGAKITAIARDEVKELLDAKGTSTAKLRKSLSGKMEKPKDIPGYTKGTKIKKLEQPKQDKLPSTKLKATPKNLKASLKKALAKKVDAKKA
tara:strand:+ start:180 stop:542 length:363 start_codon:yes stop_codon:yes gene_type:complete